MTIGFDAFEIVDIISTNIAISLSFFRKKNSPAFRVMHLVFDINNHFLVPKHVLLSTKDIEELLQKKGFKLEEMPQIFSSDPAIKNLKAEEGDVVKIIRISTTAGKTIYYRRVVE